jgi:pyruvate/2-oxoglutarate dehydrogenase complex dihydrolipoamide dehydrogenase (E3) component
MAKKFDAIVIGTGQSGPPLADRMSREGMKVAVIERGRFGGTCVNTGCIPTKALVASARAIHVAKRAAEFGVVIDGGISIDMRKVNERMKKISGKSNRGVEKWLEGLNNVSVYRGHARFVGAKTVEVGGESLESDRIFLNVGARPSVPEVKGLDGVDHLTSSSMMKVDFLPEHLIVIGGSYIGLEFGQMYRRFGSEVTIIQRGPRLIPREDDDVSDAIRQIVEKEGIRVRTDAACMTVERRKEGIAASVTCSDGEPEVIGSHLLLAVGRTPNTGDLGLDTAGVKMDDKGYVEVDDQLRTNVPGIWAMGDCNGRGAFTHTSYNDYEIVAANLFDNDPRRLSERILCYGLFIDPPLGRVGMTEREARRSGRRVLIGKRPMTGVGRAVERSETQGFMKVLVDADSKEILGAAILGIEGDEVIHLFVDVMNARAPYTAISRAMHIHPTVAELVPTMLQGLEPLA